MSVETDLFGFLTASAPTLGPLVGSRIYPLTIPQESDMPAIAYSRISNPQRRTQDGAHLWSPRYQFDCKGKTYDDADAVAEALIADLEGKRFGSLKLVLEDGAGPDEREPDTGLFTRRVELLIWR